MPTRLIREGILDSDAVNRLSSDGEVFYRRLMSIVDDYGRWDGRVPLLRSRLFGLQLSRWTEKKVQEALDECVQVGLIVAYVVDGKEFICIDKFGQRTRTPSKFPSPADSCAQMSANVRKCPPYSEAYAETDAKAETDADMALAAPKIQLGEFGHVTVTEEEFAKLQQELGPLLQDYVDRFDGWVHESPNAKASGGKRKDRNPYLSIRAWFRKDKSEGRVKTNHGHSQDPNTDAIAEGLRRRAARRADSEVAPLLRGTVPDVRQDGDPGEAGPLVRTSLGPEPF